MSLNDIDCDDLEKNLDPLVKIVIQFPRKQNAELLAANKDQLEQNKKQTDQITHLSEQIDDLRNMLFGRKSEKMPSMKSEIRRAITEEELFAKESPDAELDEKEKGADLFKRRQGSIKSTV